MGAQERVPLAIPYYTIIAIVYRSTKFPLVINNSRCHERFVEMIRVRRGVAAVIALERTSVDGIVLDKRVEFL